MRIGIVGTAGMARALGAGWVRAGHRVQVGGRSPQRAREAARESGAEAVELATVTAGQDAVLVALPGLVAGSVLAALGAHAGTVLIDVTNRVEHGTGVLAGEPDSVSAQLAARFPLAAVVKAFNLFPATTWPVVGAPAPTVALAGDDPAALSRVATLVTDVGGAPHVLGGLARARQLEETAGFVIGMAFAGIGPAAAVPG